MGESPQIEAIYRAESRGVFATLVRLLGDFVLAEEALQDAFLAAVDDAAAVCRNLLNSLETNAPPKNREEEAARARARAAQRFAAPDRGAV